MSLQVGCVDHDRLRLGAGCSQTFHHSREHTCLAPTLPPIVQRLVRAVLAGCISPAQPVAIDEYAKTVTAVPSPYLVNGTLSESAKRGEALFQQAGCATCHPAPLYTDLQAYSVGTGKDREADMKFDTPTLVEVWRTAPYLHDGRAATMLDMLKSEASGAQHCPSGLTEEQLADLAAYVLSL